MARETPGFGGRAALVTGAARGIGLAIAGRLVAGGARVALADVDLARAAAEADRLGKIAGRPDGAAMAVHLDVTDPASVDAGVRATIDAFGGLDILVNNAGIHGPSVPTWEMPLEDWHRVLAVDLHGVFYCCRAVLPHMRAKRYGRIVNIASIAGKEGNPNALPYSAAKAGVIGLTKALAKEVARDGIVVNAVTPAVIETEILQQVSPEHVAYMLARIPMGRAGRPAEVAALVAWLCSEECSFSTGAVVDISGGRATY
ncbi:MAG: SDR family NAD(P)-dependent oxidoreductase [Armatimonadota bacterium]|nr:SDR family NAD(P)-dependent oxidoreductase [Armatimonadota bacterium]